MTNEERVLALIRSSANGLTDREIRERTGISPHQQVNRICNRLAKKGLTSRERGPDNVLVNRSAVEDDAVLSLPARDRTKERHDGTVGLLEIELGSALLVVPCSGGKRLGGVEGVDGVSILDFLPEELADELRDVRKRNARACQVDESLRMAAVERYCGTLYQSAGRSVEQLCRSVAGLAIISGGYGVVLGREQIGWYEQRFEQAMWPDDLVGRCLSAYARAIGARTAVGLFGATTSYARAFQRVGWPREIEQAWLVSPVGGRGALRKVPRALGEALVAIGSSGALAADWMSRDDVPVRITRIGVGATRTADAGARQPREEQSSASRGTSSTDQALRVRDGVREIRIALDEDDARRLEAAARLAGEVAGDFYEGRLDLATRGETATTGWSSMPEVEAAQELRRGGVSERSIRHFLTFVSAMDRARDAIRLWRAGSALFQRHPDVFDPAIVSSMTSADVAGFLSAAGVSQRHGPDSHAWWTISRSLTEGTGAVCRLVTRGDGDAVELLADLRSVDSAGRPRFPMLKGPKVGPMWVRIMANPGAARIQRIAKIPVAVDTHVRRVTRNLGVARGGLEGATGKRC